MHHSISHLNDPLTGDSGQELHGDEILTVDDILSQIGYGRYHLKTYFILGMVLMSDGAENIVLSILQNVLKTEWALTATQTNFITTAVFIGLFLGAILSGEVADRCGRRKPLLLFTILLYIFGVASAFSTNYIALALLRSVNGFLIGLQFPMCFTYITEITPKEVRGRYLVLAGGFFTLGELLPCGLSYLTLNGITSGNWRLLLILTSTPALICWLGLIFVLHESPRYLIASRKELAAGSEILLKIAEHNHAELFLGPIEQQGLARWIESQENLQNKQVASLTSLFRGKAKKITLYLWAAWFIISLSYFGMAYILPSIVAALNTSEAHNHQDIWSITLPCLMEFPAIVLVLLVIENDWFGRRRTMIAGFLFTAVCCLLAGSAPFFELWTTLSRVMLNSVFIIAAPYSSELYPTTIRATGLGMASSFSRTAGACMPWFTQSLFDMGPKMPFVGFGVFSILGAFCCHMIPYDTTKKELDFEYKPTKPPARRLSLSSSFASHMASQIASRSFI